MPWKFQEGVGKVRREGGLRLITIPEEFTLVGEDVIVCQDKDGTIMIQPATEEGRQALERFSPFGDWTEEDFARMETPEWQRSFEALMDKTRRKP